MPLPFLAAVPAIIAAFSTTTLVVGGVVTAIGVMASLGALLEYIDERKEEIGADEARIEDLIRNGEYVTLNVGLTKRGRLLETVKAEVKDEERKLKVGMRI